MVEIWNCINLISKYINILKKNTNDSQTKIKLQDNTPKFSYPSGDQVF